MTKTMTTESILAEAGAIVNGSRNADYGDAAESFTRIAEICRTAFEIDLSPADVCRVLMAVKLARESYRHKRDNLVDLCGYAELLNRIIEHENDIPSDKKRPEI